MTGIHLADTGPRDEFLHPPLNGGHQRTVLQRLYINTRHRSKTRLGNTRRNISRGIALWCQLCRSIRHRGRLAVMIENIDSRIGGHGQHTFQMIEPGPDTAC